VEQWRQVDYLLEILQPFHKFTTILSRTKDITIHLVFKIYNKLFEHLEKSIQQLRRKRVAWKQLMLTSLKITKNKLSSYYKDTDKIDGYLYTIGTILSPQDKLQYFATKDWDPDPADPNSNYREKYRQSLEAFMEKYSEHVTEEHPQPNTPLMTMALSELESACAPDQSQQSQNIQVLQSDELSKYLNSSKYLQTFFNQILIYVYRYYPKGTPSYLVERPPT
jgi:hypothetical protein